MSDCFATTSGLWFTYTSGTSWVPAAATVEPKRGREWMTLYKVYLVDLGHGLLTSEHTVIGRNEEDAALKLRLTDSEMKLRDKDELEVLWDDVGEFQKISKTRVTIEKDEE